MTIKNLVTEISGGEKGQSLCIKLKDEFKLFGMKQCQHDPCAVCMQFWVLQFNVYTKEEVDLNNIVKTSQ